MIATRCPNRSDHRDPAEVSLFSMIVTLIIIETVLVVVAQLMLRHGAIKLATPILSVGIVVEAVQSVWIMSGLALHGISFFLYVVILSRLRLNVIYPIATGASLALITVLSVIILKEKLTAVQVVGISIIMVGMVLVYVER
jgi:multidrug transporter EmrE-like cation transporter